MEISLFVATLKTMGRDIPKRIAYTREHAPAVIEALQQANVTNLNKPHAVMAYFRKEWDYIQDKAEATALSTLVQKDPANFGRTGTTNRGRPKTFSTSTTTVEQGVFIHSRPRKYG